MRHVRRHWLRVMEVGLVVFEVNPLTSEPLRYGVLFAAQGFTDNIIIAALAFGLITLCLDVVSALAMADLLRHRMAVKIIDKTNEVVRRVGLSHLTNRRTSYLVDVLVTFAIGTPLTLMLKHRQDTTRTHEQNVALGLQLSAIASLAAALQGAAIVAGIWHPSPITVVLALAAIASFVAVQRWLRRRFN